MTRASGRLRPSGARARCRLVSCPRWLSGAGVVSGAVTGPLPGWPPPPPVLGACSPTWARILALCCSRASDPVRVAAGAGETAARAAETCRPRVTGRRPRPASGSSVGATLLLSEESQSVCPQNFFAFGPAFLGFNSYKPCRGQEYVYLGSLIFKWKNFCSPRKLIYSHLQ